LCGKHRRSPAKALETLHLPHRAAGPAQLEPTSAKICENDLSRTLLCVHRRRIRALENWSEAGYEPKSIFEFARNQSDRDPIYEAARNMIFDLEHREYGQYVSVRVMPALTTRQRRMRAVRAIPVASQYALHAGELCGRPPKSSRPRQYDHQIESSRQAREMIPGSRRQRCRQSRTNRRVST